MVVQRIERAETQRLQCVFGRAFVAFAEHVHQGAETEGERRIAVHLQRAVERADRAFVVVRDVRMDERPDAQRLRIVCAEAERDAACFSAAALSSGWNPPRKKRCSWHQAA